MASRYRLVMLLWAMQFVNYLDRINISVAAPTMMKSLSIDLEPRGVTTLLLHPGWVQTDMGGPNALISAEETLLARFTPPRRGPGLYASRSGPRPARR